MENVRYSMKTFGCKVNTYDSSLLQKQLSQTSPIQNQYHIVNTCAVTETAILESLRWIRRYRRKNPDIVIVVTGCGTQVQLDDYANSPDVDLVIANSHKHLLSEILEKYGNGDLGGQKVFHSNIFKNSPLGKGGQVEQSHTRFFLKIQDGCDQFCTFCIIPFARGKSRSLSIPYLVDQINEKHSAGVQEVVLTGVHIGDYQNDGQGLSGLVLEILKQTKIPRIRLSSLEPIELTDSLMELYHDERMCKHFHLSIQSGSTSVLEKMKRKYTQEQVRSCLNNIEKKFPKSYVGMDLIAGFPSETQENFEETYELFQNTDWTEMHVFPYSPRPKTYALKIESDLSTQQKIKRASLLRNLSYQRLGEKAEKELGKIKHILPLKKGGISRDYWHVEWSDQEASYKDEIPMKLMNWDRKAQRFFAKPI